MGYGSYTNKAFLQKPKPDWVTIILYILLSTFGVMNVFSASISPDDTDFWDMGKNHTKQLVFMIVALAMGFSVMMLSYGFLQVMSYVIYGVVMLLMVVVLVQGVTVAASKSWINLGIFRLQPAEFAKFATALALSRYLSGYDVKFTGVHTLVSFAIVGAPLLLTLAQNDTGSALVFFSFALVFYREGMHGFWLAIGAFVIVLFVCSIIFDNYMIWIALTVLAALAILIGKRLKNFYILVLIIWIGSLGINLGVDFFFHNVLKPYQQDRILVILDLKEDPQGIGYNLNQSKIAIGAGQLHGRGFMQGTQNKMGFVPEQSTDFIFCTIGEEWGFIGSTIFLVVYGFFLGRIAYLANRQRATYARVLGFSTFSILLFHFFINIGMTIGLVPIIGIPLPFFSYGGSSFIAFTFLLFAFLNQDSHRVFEMYRD